MNIKMPSYFELWSKTETVLVRPGPAWPCHV